MKSFLTCWLAEAARVFESQFTGKPELLPCARLPQPEKAVTFAITFGASHGRFLVSADRDALSALFAANKINADGQDNERQLGTWRNVLQQIADSAVRLFDPSVGSMKASVEPATWIVGKPSAAFELRFGEIFVPMSFTDEVEVMQVERQKASLKSLPEDSAGKAPGGIDLLLDIELEASLRFGSREMSLNEVLDLGAGDVVELDRHVSDPVDLLVGDRIVARGEVVLINGSFGLRVLEVAEPKKRLESIRCLF